jgi:hypothetical protein
MFENKVLRKIFGPKNDEVSEQVRILHNMELCDLHRPSDFVRIVKNTYIGGCDGLAMWLDAVNMCSRDPKTNISVGSYFTKFLYTFYEETEMTKGPPP